MAERSRVLVAVGVGSATAFALMARAVARRRTARVDRATHARTAIDPDHPVRQAAEAASPIGKWWTYAPAAVLTAGYVAAARTRLRRRRTRVYGAASIVLAAAAAATLNHLLDELPQPPAPPGRSSPTHPVFPSGHAFGTSSVALTAAYVLTREELAAAAIVFPLALSVPLATSVARLLEEKHWISDIVGGHLAALALASLAAAMYEAGRADAEY